MPSDVKDKEPAKEAPKGGAIPAKKSRPDDDEGGEKGALTLPLKQKMLATALSRSIVIAAIVGSLAVAVSGLLSGRYELVAAPNSTNSYMYRLDRLTGGIQFCGPQGCTDVGHAGTAEK